MPASPRDSTAVGTPCATPWARSASAMPGHLAVEHRAVTSGVRSVGESPVPPVVTTTSYAAATAVAQRLLHRLAVRHDLAVRRPRSPARPGRRRAPARCGPRRRRRPPGWRRVTTSALMDDVRRPAVAPVPGLPPVLPSTRTSVMTARGSTALTMSTSVEAGDGDAGQRLHLDAGAVGGAHGGGDRDGVVVDPRSTVDAVDGDRVAQRDEVGRALRAQDAGDPRDGERVALGHAAAAQQRDHLGRHEHPAGRRRASAR